MLSEIESGFVSEMTKLFNAIVASAKQAGAPDDDAARMIAQCTVEAIAKKRAVAAVS